MIQSLFVAHYVNVSVYELVVRHFVDVVICDIYVVAENVVEVVFYVLDGPGILSVPVKDGQLFHADDLPE